MTFRFGPRIRHPFFPGLSPMPARVARGVTPALSGIFPELVRAAARGVTAQRAVFVLIGWDAPPLMQEERDLLWELFQTPVYALLLGTDGRVAGFECEAQNGFHGAGRYDSSTPACECGRPRPAFPAAYAGAGAFAPAAAGSR